VRHHLKEEESQFFQVAGRLLSATRREQLARKYTREIVRIGRRHTLPIQNGGRRDASGRVKPAKRAATKPATRGNARTGANCEKRANRAARAEQAQQAGG